METKFAKGMTTKITYLLSEYSLEVIILILYAPKFSLHGLVRGVSYLVRRVKIRLFLFMISRFSWKIESKTVSI